MPNTLHRPTASRASSDPSLHLVQVWLHANAAGLLNASLLLGGPAAHRRGLRLIDEIREAERLTQRHRRELVSLHRLLTLADVGDPDRDETGRFAELNPASREVMEICLVSDSLYALLRRIADEPGREQTRREPCEAPRAAA